jgi:peptidoglycan hydrolase-like protein with peptidoglycan-binding domain
MAFPGRAVRKGDSRPDVVGSLQTRLNAVGCGPVDTDGVFGDQTESAVKLFQTRRNLDPDGVVGPLTWSELFLDAGPANETAVSALLARALTVALSQDGVREKGGPNRGPEVEGYLARVGLAPTGGYSWCQAFVYWSFDEAAKALTRANPVVKTAGVLDHWTRSPLEARVYAKAAFDDPTLIHPGAIFIVDHGDGKGHTGIVTRIAAGEIGTIEGNTNARGSREGDGVYQKTRTIGSINVGFIDYGLLEKT